MIVNIMPLVQHFFRYNERLILFRYHNHTILLYCVSECNRYDCCIQRKHVTLSCCNCICISAVLYQFVQHSVICSDKRDNILPIGLQ